MINFVLDDLSGKSLKGLEPYLHLRILVFQLDLPVPCRLTGAAQKGQTAFLCFVWN